MPLQTHSAAYFRFLARDQIRHFKSLLCFGYSITLFDINLFNYYLAQGEVDLSGISPDLSEALPQLEAILSLIEDPFVQEAEFLLAAS